MQADVSVAVAWSFYSKRSCRWPSEAGLCGACNICGPYRSTAGIPINASRIGKMLCPPVRRGRRHRPARDARVTPYRHDAIALGLLLSGWGCRQSWVISWRGRDRTHYAGGGWKCSSAGRICGPRSFPIVGLRKQMAG